MANMKQSGTAQKGSASLEKIRRRSFFCDCIGGGIKKYYAVHKNTEVHKHRAVHKNRQEEKDYGRL